MIGVHSRYYDVFMCIVDDRCAGYSKITAYCLVQAFK